MNRRRISWRVAALALVIGIGSMTGAMASAPPAAPDACEEAKTDLKIEKAKLNDIANDMAEAKAALDTCSKSGKTCDAEKKKYSGLHKTWTQKKSDVDKLQGRVDKICKK